MAQWPSPPRRNINCTRGRKPRQSPSVRRPAPTPLREARRPHRRRHNAGPRRIGERSPCPPSDSPAKHPKKDEERVGPRAADGSYLRIRARRSAVLAAGGFSASREMMSKYHPLLQRRRKCLRRRSCHEWALPRRGAPNGAFGLRGKKLPCAAMLGASAPTRARSAAPAAGLRIKNARALLQRGYERLLHRTSRAPRHTPLGTTAMRGESSGVCTAAEAPRTPLQRQFRRCWTGR